MSRRRQYESHGDSHARLYNVWSKMKTRCTCKTSVNFPYYGARGVTVCREWTNSYLSFRNWALSHGYRETLQIDRKDVNGNYTPENCRWVTRIQQMQNCRKRSNATTSRFKGVSWCANATQWRVQLCKNGKPLHIGLFVSEEEAAHAYDQAAIEHYGAFAHLNYERSRSS